MGESFASRLRRTLDQNTGIVEYSFSKCNLQNAEDVYAFFKAMADSLSEIPKPRDVVVCLDELIVAPTARPLFGEERAKLAKEYYRFSARYAGTTATKIATMTSAVRYQAEGMVYETREDAFKAILEHRTRTS
jgi:hypothetical protein